tara:strand:+ start:357 stop:716 length:360 start_codon:yes stop_codon:yes gene_type:complete
MATITFSNNINVSAQVGDILFYHTFTGDPGTALGEITVVGPNFVEVDSNSPNINNIAVGNFFSFKKSNGVFEDDNGNEIGYYHSNSSIKGYYAKVKISQTSSVKKELFYLGSEITESSK